MENPKVAVITVLSRSAQSGAIRRLYFTSAGPCGVIEFEEAARHYVGVSRAQ